MISQTTPPKRAVRSFVRRQSHFSATQKAAFEKFWKVYGLELRDEKWQMESLFQRQAKTILEIGFGMGDTLAEQAEKNPEINFMGIEVHTPGIGNLFLKLHENNNQNVRVFCTDAKDVLEKMIPDESLDAIQLFFPDPWPKRKHHKRRLVQPDFIDLIYQKLKPNGYFHMATDWEDYAKHVMKLFKNETRFTFSDETALLLERPHTKFEKRGERLGHKIQDLIFVKNGVRPRGDRS